MDSSSHHPQSEGTESAKPTNPKKRKKTSIFTGKKKRLKIKKSEPNVASTSSANDSKVEEESFVSNDSLNDSACATLETASIDCAQRDITDRGEAPQTCDNIVNTDKESDLSNSTSKDTPVLASSNCSSSTVNESSISVELVPSENTSLYGNSKAGDFEKQDTCVDKSPVLDGAEKFNPSLELAQEKQLDSAYLSCESDRSGRDEEDLGSGGGSKMDDTCSQKPVPSQVKSSPQVKNEIGNDLTDAKAELKEASQIRTQLFEILKTEVEVKKEEDLPVGLEGTKLDSDDTHPEKPTSLLDGGIKPGKHEEQVDIKGEVGFVSPEKTLLSTPEGHVGKEALAESSGTQEEHMLTNGVRTAVQSNQHEQMETAESGETKNSGDAEGKPPREPEEGHVAEDFADKENPMNDDGEVEAESEEDEDDDVRNTRHFVHL